MCDCLVALGPASASGHTLFAKNSDRPTSEPQVMVTLPSRLDSTQLHCTHIEISPHHRPTHAIIGLQPRWTGREPGENGMWGLEAGVNDKGVAVGNERIFTTADPRLFPSALTGMDLVRLALERAETAREAVEVITALLKRYGQGGSCFEDRDMPYWSSFLIADPTTAFVLETSAREYAFENVWKTRAISNRTTIPEFDTAFGHPGVPNATRTDPRLALSNACLASRPVSVDSLRAHLQSHEGTDGWSVCMHVQAGDHAESTTGSMIAELTPWGSTVWLCEGSPCTNTYTEHRFPAE